MEQILFDAFETGPDSIRNAIVKEIENPEYIQYLSVDTLKDGSISIKAKNIIVAKVKIQKKASYLEIRTKNAENIATDIAIEKHNDEWCRIKISGVEDVLALRKELSAIFVIVLSEMGGESFGCCHRYEACSDAKKCIHPNLMTALACAYRKNLEAGRIFYGKNKTV